MAVAAVLLDLRLCYSMVVFLELQAQLCVSLELDHLAHVLHMSKSLYCHDVYTVYVLLRQCDYVILSYTFRIDMELLIPGI